MKSKYIFGLLAVGTAMSLVSCDDFIDDNRYPLDRQTVNPEFWSNDVNVQNQINYFYEDYSGYGNGSGGGDFYWSWLSDDQAGRTKFADWTFTSIPATSGSWTAPYTEIRRANLVIEGVESSTLNDVAKANFIAQARLHRARSFYDLVRRYGDVPLVTKALDPTDQAELFGARTPR
ncbi:MAG: RagB/SusD family nutrient uptake outer membrane protein, partial [Bacteroidales bacterium]|nr:RagB/SusD family nutrient uptake outer membrane protein [Bacteroidales bacterium]MDD6959760.1 RagB/SusD family nutrient uptake outer membrane protein [Bacteroidales bacterium]MDY6187143.1 RagB/SusD family nutrient uptake outer membrane protein [Muribaculaceae bacterium]